MFRVEDHWLPPAEASRMALAGGAGAAVIGGGPAGSFFRYFFFEMAQRAGFNVSDTIVQRGIDSYVLHVDAGSVRIDTPLHEMRIGAVHRDSGPRDLEDIKYGSFDGYLQTLAIEKGADLRRELVTGIDRKNLMRRVHEDPALARSLVETMSRRIRELSNELARIKRAAAPTFPTTRCSVWPVALTRPGPDPSPLPARATVSGA